MEQMSFDTVVRSEEDIIQEAMVAELNNAEHSKYLSVKRNKDQTISIWANTELAAKIKLDKTTRYMVVRQMYLDRFADYISSHELQVAEAVGKRDWVRIPISTVDDVVALTKPLCVVYMLVLSEQGGSNSFGCCDLCVKCSDAKKCVHPDYFHSLGCYYRRNLEAGRIFYGKNKNNI